MSRGNNLIIFTFVLAALTVNQIFGRKLYAYFESLECPYYDANYAEIASCWLMPNQRGELTMNAKLVLKQDLPSIIVNYRFIIARKDKNVTYINMDIDVCSALGAVFKNPVLRLVTEEIRRVSNLPLGCPLKKGIEYSLDNFTINSKYLPPFTPYMNWITKATFSTNSSRRSLLIVDSFGKVDNKMKKHSPAV